MQKRIWFTYIIALVVSVSVFVRAQQVQDKKAIVQDQTEQYVQEKLSEDDMAADDGDNIATGEDQGDESTQENSVVGPQRSSINKQAQEDFLQKADEKRAEQNESEEDGDELNLFVVDHDKKKNTVVELVDNGSDRLANLDLELEDICRAFTHTDDFIRGEIYLFVYDINGICFAHGLEPSLLWQDMSEYRDSFDLVVFKELKNKALDGGGWVTYEWRNATKLTYTKRVVRNEREYVIGAGYYPHSKAYEVLGLVKNATSLFKRAIAEGKDPATPFSEMTYANGRFVRGDLYLFVFDEKGITVAHGDVPGLVGGNQIGFTSEDNRKIVQEMIAQAQTNPETGFEIKYQFRNTEKLAYVESVKDATGKQYVIGCGYYPNETKNEAIRLADKTYDFIQKNGIAKLVEITAIKDLKTAEFRFGGISIVVYKKDGTCVAHGERPSAVGENFAEVKDQSGYNYMQEILNDHTKEAGWVDAKLKNAYQSWYVSPITLDGELYLITVGLYASTPYDTISLLTNTTIGSLASRKSKRVFYNVTNPHGSFVRGDLDVFVFDRQGICYAYGDNHNLIWRNLLDVKDDEGRPFVQLFIKAADEQRESVLYKMRGVQKVAYVKRIEKEGEVFIVGSSMFF